MSQVITEKKYELLLKHCNEVDARLKAIHEMLKSNDAEGEEQIITSVKSLISSSSDAIDLIENMKE